MYVYMCIIVVVGITSKSRFDVQAIILPWAFLPKNDGNRIRGRGWAVLERNGTFLHANQHKPVDKFYVFEYQKLEVHVFLCTYEARIWKFCCVQNDTCLKIFFNLSKTGFIEAIINQSPIFTSIQERNGKDIVTVGKR